MEDRRQQRPEKRLPNSEAESGPETGKGQCQIEGAEGKKGHPRSGTWTDTPGYEPHLHNRHEHRQCNLDRQQDRIGKRTALPCAERGQESDRADPLDELSHDPARKQEQENAQSRCIQ